MKNKKERSEREIIHHLSRPLLLLFKSGKIKIGPFLNKPSFPRRDMRYDSNIRGLPRGSNETCSHWSGMISKNPKLERGKNPQWKQSLRYSCFRKRYWKVGRSPILSGRCGTRIYWEIYWARDWLAVIWCHEKRLIIAEVRLRPSSSEPGAVLGIMGVEFCFRGVRSGSLRSYPWVYIMSP